MTCPLCQPDQVFHQGPLTRALWCAQPRTPGHAQVVTRRHLTDWFAAAPAEQRELTESLNLVRDAILAAGHLPEGFQVSIEGEPHLHVNLVPRYQRDATPLESGHQQSPVAVNAPPSHQTATQTVGGKTDPSLETKRLVTGHGDPLLDHLCEHLDGAVGADIAVAFVTHSGLELVLPRLRELLERDGSVRLLTGDQEQFNHPAALRRLLDLASFERCQLRVFQCSPGIQFHPKFYLFEAREGRVNAFVGSSNLTEQALKGGVEWNYRVAEDVAHLRSEFEALFRHDNTRVLDEDWIADYARRRTFRDLGGASLVADRPVPAEEELPPPPEPHEIQQEALAALQQTRAQGYQAGLVVLATGLGKTWLAAFDSQQFRRVLFVAHREEILTQARETFRRIRPQATLGLYTGQEKLPRAEAVFASIQTLGRVHHLRGFAPDSFDYIVVDEFHHASAATYRRLIEHFTPKFLLGLTATPERSDGGDLLGLCEENLVFRCDFWDGIRRGRLSPFHYFGVPDLVDYQNIPWRSARFDPEALEHAVITEARAENALEQYRKRGGRRTLAFCCSLRHADYMAEYFRQNGVRAVAVHSAPHSAPRTASLEKLGAGDLDVICCVDMFNEGVDVPTIDTILMLRPTESRILWLQQIGRGLRVAEGKSHVNVIDYIGNHRSFLLKPMTLLAAANQSELHRSLQLAIDQELELPPGCAVTYELETVDILRALMVRAPEALESYYKEFTELHGLRPQAREAFHEARKPRSAHKAHGSWLGFVAAQTEGLTAAQTRAYREQRAFLEGLEKAEMVDSSAMLVLEAMLAQDALPGALPVRDLAGQLARLAGRSPVFRDDFAGKLEDQPALIRFLEEGPIAHWCRGPFRYEDQTLRFVPVVEEREAFQELVREVLEWRLAEFLTRPRVATTLECKVRHASGKPILFLPDRRDHPELPSGWTPLLCDDKRYEANFVKIALNVIREEGSEANVLPRVLRGWFGPDAGLPGTSFRVGLERAGEGWRMRPIRLVER